VDDVHRRSQGNPFFVRQLATLVADGDRAAAVADGAIPVGVRHVLVQRFQQVPQEVRATLELAAVVGLGFDVRTVAAAGDADVLTVLDHVDVAIRHGLVEVGDAHASAYRFVHALFRETLCTDLAHGRSQRLHEAVAAALRQHDVPPAEAVAEHLWRAADIVPTADSVHWLRKAADEASSVLGYEQAEQHLRRALELLARGDGDAGTELEVRLRLVQVLTGLYGWTAAAREEVSGRVRELAGHTAIGAELVPLWWSLWSTAMTRGDLRASGDLAEELLAQAVAADEPASLVAGHVAVAYTGLFAGDDLDAVLGRLRLAAGAEAAADPASLALTPEHLAVSLRVNLAIAHALHGNVAEVATACHDLVACGRRVGGLFHDAYANLFASWAMAVIDRPEDALAYATAGLALCDEARLGHVAHLITPIHGWAAARCGADPCEQSVRIGAAIHALEAAGQSHAVANWHLLHAEILAMDGEVDAATTALDRARALSQHIGETVYEPQLLRVQVKITS
jgi:tetratricopeptide (TPR) repeat protein